MPCRSWRFLGCSKRSKARSRSGAGADLSGQEEDHLLDGPWQDRQDHGHSVGLRRRRLRTSGPCSWPIWTRQTIRFQNTWPTSLRPPEASDPAIALKWLDKLQEHALQQGTSLLVDLGGGDTTLRRLVTQLPDLVAMFEAQGFAVVVLYAVGPQEEDPPDRWRRWRGLGVEADGHGDRAQ